MEMMKKRKAFTLMEVIIYMSVFALTGLLIATIFQVSRRAQSSSAAAYAVSGQTDTAIHWIRQDLQETVLGSIYSVPGSTGMLPAVSMASSRTVDPTGSDAQRQGKLLISEYGVPLWRKHQLYGIRRKAGRPVGDLVRWDIAYTGDDVDRRLPLVLPRGGFPSSAGNARIILHNVLLPGETVSGLGGLPGGQYKANDDWGGFRVQFVRKVDGEDSAETSWNTDPNWNINPALNKTRPEQNTRLVEVELVIAEMAMGTGKPNFYRLSFRVCPRY